MFRGRLSAPIHFSNPAAAGSQALRKARVLRFRRCFSAPIRVSSAPNSFSSRMETAQSLIPPSRVCVAFNFYSHSPAAGP